MNGEARPNHQEITLLAFLLGACVTTMIAIAASFKYPAWKMYARRRLQPPFEERRARTFSSTIACLGLLKSINQTGLTVTNRCNNF